MYPRFGLVLMMTHACNLKCEYCYTGAKFHRVMSESVGRKAIDRAMSSLGPGGTLELGFFGGEPLLEPALISTFIQYARQSAAAAGHELQLSLTTNGTQTSPAAWKIMTLPDLDLAVSHDGLPDVHDRHRRSLDERGTSEAVLTTLKRLLDWGKPFRVVMVVRPENLEFLAAGIEFLYGLGVRRVEPSLDLWTRWEKEDGPRLESALHCCAEIWRDRLPDFGLSWFDERAAQLAGVAISATARCGFGNGEVAVAPSGRLYPCERLIGEDSDCNPMRLPGHALEGEDFLGFRAAEPRSAAPCSDCAIRALCGTTCRCANYVRTGHVGQPDGLLCLFDQVCWRETARIFSASQPIPCEVHV